VPTAASRTRLIWVADRLAALTAALDSIRDAWDGPIMVVCGYRTAAYNEALARASAARNGGASGVALNSQHIQGQGGRHPPRRADRRARG
jgi:uncharacterized protein YcbK (DUF882 family)